jgi:hypothetical protein
VKLTEEQRQLVAKNMGLVNVHIRRFVALPRSASREREYEDIFQEGCLALMEAARTHNPAAHGPFAAYAIPKIHHAISIALYEHFSTVRVPAKAIKRARRRVRVGRALQRHRPEPALIRTHAFTDESLDNAVGTEVRHQPGSTTRPVGRPWRPERPTVRVRLREKYEAAVRTAAERLSGGLRGRDDRDALIKRFVEERFLVPDPNARTPKRQLARDFRCSIGRIESCEDSMVAAIRSLLGADEEFALLLRLAHRDQHGMDAVIDRDVAVGLDRAAIDGFARRYGRLPADQQGMVLRDLVRMTLGSLSGFAGRLFGRLDARRRCAVLGMVRVGETAERLQPSPSAEPSRAVPRSVNRCGRR